MILKPDVLFAFENNNYYFISVENKILLLDKKGSHDIHYSSVINSIGH